MLPPRENSSQLRGRGLDNPCHGTRTDRPSSDAPQETDRVMSAAENRAPLSPLSLRQLRLQNKAPSNRCALYPHNLEPRCCRHARPRRPAIHPESDLSRCARPLRPASRKGDSQPVANRIGEFGEYSFSTRMCDTRSYELFNLPNHNVKP